MKFNGPKTPEQGDRFVVANAENHLVAIEVFGCKEIETKRGRKEAIEATVHDITQQKTYEDVLLFPKVMVRDLKECEGTTVLARIVEGVAKPGENAPWLLDDMSDNEDAIEDAEEYIAEYRADLISGPKRRTKAPA